MANRPKVLELWDEPQLDPLSLPPETFEGLDIEEAVERIKEWFFDNFADPAQETPYNGREGGYLYIWGGPYSARDVIENVFAETASDELIAAAINAIEEEGLEWVPNGLRIQPPEEEWQEEERVVSPLPDPKALHEEMLSRIATLEEAMARISASPARIGHNNPPEPIDPVPFSERDRSDIQNAIALLKAQPIEPQEPKAVVEAATTIKTIGEKLQAYAARHADSFITEAVKTSGSEFGKWGVRAGYLLLAEPMIRLSHTVFEWLKAVGLPF